MKHKAAEVAGDPELYDKAYWLPRSRMVWECMGWSLKGKTVRFARLVTKDVGRVAQVNRYVDPDTVVEVASRD